MLNNQFLRCVGEAVVAKGLQALAGTIPFGAVVYDIAAEALKRWKEKRREQERRQEIQDLAAKSFADAKEAAIEVVKEVAAGQSEAICERLEAYLAQIPATIQHSLSRPEDPSGLTVPIDLSLDRPETLARFLPSQTPRFHPGARPECLRGDWELEELLGFGGFGEVWKAKHVDLPGNYMAVKFCLDPEMQDRLLRHEARVVNQVLQEGNHSGIVALRYASLRTSPPWLGFEYVGGGDLINLFSECRPLSPTERVQRILPVFHQLAEIVGHFHRLDPPVVHRDLKPNNILIQRASTGWKVRVADFGIGQLATRPGLELGNVSTPNLSMAKTLWGAQSPLYASPQQRKGEPPDVRDDVYALGVLLYQLLVCDPQAERPTGRSWRKSLGEAGVPEDLLEVIEVSIDSEPSVRPADGRDLLERIDERRRVEGERARKEATERRETEDRRIQAQKEHAEAERVRLQKEQAERELRIEEADWNDVQSSRRGQVRERLIRCSGFLKKYPNGKFYQNALQLNRQLEQDVEAETKATRQAITRATLKVLGIAAVILGAATVIVVVGAVIWVSIAYLGWCAGIGVILLPLLIGLLLYLRNLRYDED